MPPEDQVFRTGVHKYANFNLTALLQLAESIRGQQCYCDETQTPKRGTFNWVVTLVFGDGVKWIFRSPLPGCFGSSERLEAIVASEAATIKYLKNHSSIPVPQVFAYSAVESNPIGVRYILMSHADGVPLSSYMWKTPQGLDAALDGESPEPPAEKRVLSEEDKKKVLAGVAGVMAQLMNVRFGRIGSLFERDDDGVAVGECLAPAFTWMGRDLLLRPQRGPFSSSWEFYVAQIDFLADHVRQLPMLDRILGAPKPIAEDFDAVSTYQQASQRWRDYVTLARKGDSSRNRLDFYITCTLIQNVIPLLATSQLAPGEATDAMPTAWRDTFPLWHPDLNAGNIYVDDALNITCVIDWTSATTAPTPLLLATPALPHLWNEPTGSHTATFRVKMQMRVPELTLGPELCRRAEAARRFVLFTTMGSSREVRDLQALQRFLADTAETAQSVTWFVTTARRQQKWAAALAKLEEKDASAGELWEAARNYFAGFATREERMALAMKVTDFVEKQNVFCVIPPQSWSSLSADGELALEK
ncbi:hypothetical protein VTK73DRAFT_5633 [Phialemonium thermophilum]|uniref:Aminoglycoside phosphotransferase domain-containing protein n=1 Tax=Phialemonium thermophilum TaxID=223376 RepID=A0ABR3WMR5_9PEZI